MTGWQVWLCALAALAAVTWRPSWRLLRHVVTIAHEGGHAAVAVAAGRRLGGVRLHSDTSGVTISSGAPTGAGVVLVYLAGHVAPAALGLLGAWALARGYVVPVAWTTVGLLAVLLAQVRNVFGVVSVVLTGAGLLAVTRWAPAPWLEVAVTGGVWVLLLGAPRAVVELQGARRRGRGRASDADQLARLTRVPGLVWVGVFALLTAAATVAGGWLLLSP